MKKAITVSILIFLLLTLPYKVSAQDNKLSIAPASKVVEYTDEETEYRDIIYITNGYTHNLTVTLEPRIIIRNEDNSIEILSEHPLLSNIYIDSNEKVILPGEQSTAKVTITHQKNFNYKVLPGIIAVAKDQAGNDVNLNSSVISTFIFENQKSTVGLNLDLNVKTSLTNNKLNISGKITNTGERIFHPTGNLTVYSGTKRVNSREITTKIDTDIMPGDSIEFQETIEVNEKDANTLGLFNIYRVETEIRPSPFTTNSVDNKDIKIINLPILGLYLFIALLISIIVLYSSYIYKRSK